MGEQHTYTIRRITEDDDEAVRSIVENNPDEGDVSIAPQIEASPYRVSKTITPETVGFLAETSEGEPAGTGTVGFLTARVGGTVRRCAYLNNLAVAADHRGNGLAKRLADRRITEAETRYDDCVIWAIIQQGNDPSRAVAETWADEFTYTKSKLSLPARPDATVDHDYEIREAKPDELTEIAEQVNDFYADAELFSPYTAEKIEGRLERTPIESPIRRYLVAVDGDDIVAGTDVIDMYKAGYMAIEEDSDIPPGFPASGEVRPRAIANPWFTAANEDAVRALVEYTQTVPDGANRITFQGDPDNPITSLLLETFDATRTMKHVTAIRGDVETDPSRPVASPF